MTRISAFFTGWVLTLVSTSSAWAQDLPTPSFPVPWQLNLQTPASPVAEQLVEFHNFLLVICTVISLFVLGLLIWCAIRYNAKANPVPSKNAHNTLLEIVWTAIPVIILVVIAVPSYRLLYYMDRVEDPGLTIKVVGNQWYWTYEFPDYDIEFDSLPLPDDEIDIAAGQHRLLEVDTPLILPTDTDIRILFTATDVLHAWTIPAFGVKLDNVPGRTNETWTRITIPGKYYGQCSELCGIDHSYMPIVVHAVSPEEFEAWRAEQVAANDNTPDDANRLAALIQE
ncbi:MAG: cytochrome c oxidase subunit II [Alphaproteobacteria bacterium]|nr:cytochrome c oxidase subunit II [Alphaproteobacteria bacterium]